MKIKDVMTTDVHTVTPDTTLKEVAAILAQDRVSGVPVCDEEGQVLGVVSEADILYKEQGPAPVRGGPLAWLVDGTHYSDVVKGSARTAGEAMSAPAITISPDRPVARAARLMLEREINRLPVVKGGKLVGIVTRADLVRAFTRPDEEIEREIREDVTGRSLWLGPDEVTVTIEDGDVTLAGRLETRSDVQVLTDLVARVPGVVSLASRVTWRTDDLGRRLSQALTGSS